MSTVVKQLIKKCVNQNTLNQSLDKDDLKNVNHERLIFESFINEIELYTMKPVHSIQEIKNLNLNKKTKGDLWEGFCVLYCEKILEHNQVWLLKDVPEDVRKELSLVKKDFGIDIISKKGNDYFAIQCKYRKPTNKVQLISWKSLSTFYGYVANINKFKKHIVMTNVNGCNHIGDKTEKDLTIAFGTFKNINHFDWIKMSDSTIIQKPVGSDVDSVEYIRLKRLQFFDK